jgi:hypothetical protein
MYFNNAVVKGLWVPEPSSTVEPAFAANAIKVSEVVGSTRAKPRPTDLLATVRFIF